MERLEDWVPRFEDLNTPPDFLHIGACAIKALRHYGWIDVRKPTEDERRAREAANKRAWSARQIKLGGRRVG